MKAKISVTASLSARLWDACGIFLSGSQRGDEHICLSTKRGRVVLCAGLLAALGMVAVPSAQATSMVNPGIAKIAEATRAAPAYGLSSNETWGTTEYNNFVSGSYNGIDLNGYTLTTNFTGTIEKKIDKTGSIIVNSGALTLSANNNDYSGGTTILGGTLLLGNNNVLKNDNIFTVSGGMFNLNGYSETVGVVTLVSGTIQNSGGAAALTGSSYDVQSGTVSAVLAGNTVMLTKTTGGTVVLSGTNTYGGGTNILAGILSFGNGGLGSSGAITINGGTLQWQPGNTQDISSRLVMVGGTTATFDTNSNNVTFGTAIGNNTSASLTKTGAGILQLAAGNTYIGNTTVLAGTLKLAGGSNTTLADAGDVVVDGGILDLNAGSETIDEVTLRSGTIQNGTLTGSSYNVWSGTITANLAGSAALTKTTSGTVTLTGNNSYTGGTTISDGILSFANGSLGSTGAIGMNGGTLQWYSGNTQDISSRLDMFNGKTATFDTNGNDVTFGTAIGDNTTGSLVKTGNGVLQLSGANTYTGSTTVLGGILRLANGTSLASGSEVIVNGGTLDLSGGSSTVGQVTLTSGTIEDGTLTGTLYVVKSGTISANLAGNAALQKITAGTVVLSGDNTYTDGTTISEGILQLDGGSLTGNVMVGANGTFDLKSTSDGIGALTGSGTVTNSGTTLSTLTIGEGNASCSFTGTLEDGTGDLAIVKTGNGTLTLAGVSDYSGGTTLNAGILFTESISGLGTGPVVVNGGTLDLNNDLDIGSLSGAGGIIKLDEYTLTVDQADNGSFAGTIQGTGNLDKQGDATLTLTGASTYTGGTTITAGTLQLFGGSLVGDVEVADGAGFDLKATSDGIGRLTGDGTVTNSGASPSVLTIGEGNVSCTFDGLLQDGTSTLAIVKTGSGSLTLAGDNTYTGGTTLNAGTLFTESDSALGTGPVVITGGTLDLNDDLSIGSLSGTGGTIKLDEYTLTVDQADNGSFAGTIQGTGGLDKQGDATLTLTGASTYTGGTTITAGSLQLFGGSLVGAVEVADGAVFDLKSTSDGIGRLTGDGTVTNSGTSPSTLTIGEGDVSCTFDGPLQDGTSTLAIVKTGDGTLTLTGASSYTGGTTLNDGTIVTQNLTALGTGPVVINAGTLDLDENLNIGSLSGLAGSTIQLDQQLTVAQTVDGTYAGTIQGAGSLEKQGAARLTLTATNSYTGGTTISEGALVAGTGLAKNQKALGSGNLTIKNGATLEIPVTIATLQDLTLADSLLDIRNGSSTANLNIFHSGLINVQIADVGAGRDDLPEGIRTLLAVNTASAIAADNTDVKDSSGNSLLGDDGDQVVKVIWKDADPSGLKLVNVHRSSVAVSQLVMAELRSAEYLTSTIAERLNGRNGGSRPNQVSNRDDRLQLCQASAAAQKFESAENGIWAKALASQGRQSGHYSDAMYGGLVGYDRNLTESLTLGGYVGGYTNTIDLATGNNQVDVESLALGLYGRWEYNEFFVNATLGCGINEYDGERTDNLAYAYSSNYHGWYLPAMAEAGYIFRELGNGWYVRPSAGLQYVHLNLEEYVEEGTGPGALGVDSTRQDSLQTMLTLAVGKAFTTPWEGPGDFEAMLGYRHELLKQDPGTMINSVGGVWLGNDAIAVGGANSGRDFFRIGCKFDVEIGNGWSVSLGYGFDFGTTSYQRHNAWLSLGYQF